MSSTRQLAQRIRLRSFLFAVLVIFGSLPLVISSIITITQNRDGLETQEQLGLIKEAELITQETSSYLLGVRREVRLLGAGLGSLSEGAATTDDQLLRDRIAGFITSFQRLTSQDFATRVTDLQRGFQFGTPAAPLQEAMDQALADVRAQRIGSYTLVNRGRDQSPAVVVSEPVLSAAGEGLAFVIQGVSLLPIRRTDGDVFLIDVENQGEVLWGRTEEEPVKRAVSSTDLVQRWVLSPRGFETAEYPMRIGSRTRTMIGQIGLLADTGWAVLVHKPKSAAFLAVRRLIKTSVTVALLMVPLALGFAALVTRLIGQPIQHLVQTSQNIAAGNFGQRVSPSGMGAEIADLAESFNQMSGHVEDHVRRLREAAQINRELFIGSIRAFLAAIEAKEPYTRGHSERVASFSQAIARRLNANRDFMERIWVAGLLHDVGKIGIEDRVLNKGDVLTDEEYEEMKRHPVIGAEIMSSIEQLKETLPVIRWHHEKWNGKGYPDGLAGDQIPLMARIVAVADTFDAVTTQRVYQDPFSTEEALEIIRKLDGTGFDPTVVAAFFAAFEAGDIEIVQTVSSGKPKHSVDAPEAAVHT